MSRKFYKIHIELSDFCGLNCAFCTPRKNRRGVMGLEVFEHALKECQPYTDLIALHLLGDPLTIPSLASYLDVMDKYLLRAEITTSGFFLGERERKILAHNSIKQINISLTSYASNAKKLSLNDYMNDIFLLIHQKHLCDSPEYINLRLWNLGENVFTSEIFGAIERHFNLKIPLEAGRIRLAKKVILDIDRLFKWRDDTPKKHGYCMALKNHMAILSNGEIVPCCFDASGALSLGNLEAISLKEALESSRAIRLKEGFAKGELTEAFCEQCGYIKRFLDS